MKLVKFNEATALRRRVYFQLVAADGITPVTTEAGVQPQISTNGGAWTNTGIGVLVAIGNGRYYADLTQAAVANAGDEIETRFKSGNTAECPGDSILVVGFDPYDTVHLGLTALPNAAAGANGGLPLGDASGAVTVGTMAAGAVAAIWNALTSGITTVGSIGKRLVDNLTGDIFARLGAPAGASVSADVAGVKTDTTAIALKTANLPGLPAATGDAMTLTGGAVTAIQSGLATATALTTVGNAVTAIGTDVSSIKAGVGRLLGIAGENVVVESASYDGNGNLLTATVRVYDSSVHATTDDGTTGLVASYTITNTVTSGNVTKSLQVRTT